MLLICIDVERSNLDVFTEGGTTLQSRRVYRREERSRGETENTGNLNLACRSINYGKYII